MFGFPCPKSELRTEIQGFGSSFGKRGTQRIRQGETWGWGSAWELFCRTKQRQGGAFLTMAHSLSPRILDSPDLFLRTATCFCPCRYLCSTNCETGVNPKCNTSWRTQPRQNSNWLKSNYSACKHLSLLFFETHLNCTPEKDHFSH